jgi:hypothetical protein
LKAEKPERMPCKSWISSNPTGNTGGTLPFDVCHLLPTGSEDRLTPLSILSPFICSFRLPMLHLILIELPWRNYHNDHRRGRFVERPSGHLDLHQRSAILALRRTTVARTTGRFSKLSATHSFRMIWEGGLSHENHT